MVLATNLNRISMKLPEFTLKGKEKRGSQRIDVFWPGKLKATHESFSTTLTVFAVNASTRGVQIKTGELFAEGYHLFVGEGKIEYSLELTIGDKSFATEVGIVWYKPIENQSGFGIGLEFLDISEEQVKMLDAVFQEKCLSYRIKRFFGLLSLNPQVKP